MLKKNSQTFESIALNIIKTYDKDLTQGDPKAIPIEDILEFQYGLNIKYLSITKKGVVHGMTTFIDGFITIYDKKEKRYVITPQTAGTVIIDDKLSAPNMETRLRFTLAHELAHWIMHTEYYKSKKQDAVKLSTEQNDEQIEREADALAAAILMPKGRVKIAYGRLKHKFKDEFIVTQLANLFKVSNQAMEIRLENIGLLCGDKII